MHADASSREPEGFAPTRAAAEARIAAVRPAEYGRSRNHLDGAVSGLGPYLTHGLVSLPEVVAGVCAQHPLKVQDKFVYELGWRAYQHRVWAQRGEAILQSLHPGPLPDGAYQRALPYDLRQGCTGIPVIDRAVHTLYSTGMLHNHARMWLASYMVHLRKLHWRVGADWMYAHLLDGDLASNHLGWQWVAGTGSHQPYLFNAENVARFAPCDWHSPGTVVDQTYEQLGAWASDPQAVAALGEGVAGGAEPPCFVRPPGQTGWTEPDGAQVRGRVVWLVHPWNLGPVPADLPPDTLVLGLVLDNFHRAWPWSARRWAFVGERMAALCHAVWWGDVQQVGRALAAARQVRSQANLHLRPWLAQLADCRPPPALFPAVDGPTPSFSRWWGQATQGRVHAAALLDGPAGADGPR